jgi:glycosyltransferase involved in cell wall biosynthesis
MKILYLSNHRYDFSLKSTYNNGGWIESLTTEISKLNDFNVSIVYLANKKSINLTIDQINFFPVEFNNQSYLDRIKRYFGLDKSFRKKQTIDLIDLIKPDIIHIFGMECYACDFIEEITSRSKTLIHIQGILYPISNSFFPSFPYLFNRKMFKSYKNLKLRAFNSLNTINTVKNFSGRTDWDKNIIDLFSDNHTYYNINEIIRNEFYEANKWVLKNTNTYIIITSTISDVLYKGLDIIFNTAQLLIQKKIKFKWNVIGLTKNSDTVRFYEKHFNKKGIDINIHFLGVCKANEIIQNLLNSTLFVHPSYIENSSNSICEALLLGVPTIATNVGGISSFIKDKENGELVPSNDTCLLAARIIKISQDQSIMKIYSDNSRKVSIKRHNIESIVNSTANMYNKIINN